MTVSPTSRCRPVIRFSLRNFLLAVGIGGPLIALACWSFFADEVRANCAAVTIGDAFAPRALVDVVFVRSWIPIAKDEVLHIIVRPGGNSIPIDKTPPGYPPRSAGISIRGERVFVHGELFTPSQSPSFLVYQPQTRRVAEIGFDKKDCKFMDPQSAVDIPQWRTAVIPVLKQEKPDND